MLVIFEKVIKTFNELSYIKMKLCFVEIHVNNSCINHIICDGFESKVDPFAKSITWPKGLD